MVTVSPSGPPGLFKVAGSLPLSIQYSVFTSWAGIDSVFVEGI
jgi:hypothetical protein